MRSGVWLALLAIVVMTAAGTASNPMKVNLLFVGAHPDDESAAFATMARYVLDRGCKAAVITATRGEGGGNAAGRQQGTALGMMRETEERAALSAIGIQQVFYLDQQDPGFTVRASDAEAAWGHEALVEKLVRFYRLLQPDVVITMNPWPVGHGHHQYVARLASEAFFRGDDDKLFPGQLQDEGLTLFQPKKLLYAAEDGDVRIDTTTISPSRGVSYADLKAQALRAYRSQGWDHAEASGDESFVRAYSFSPIPDGIDTDIMAGLLNSPNHGIEFYFEAANPYTVAQGASVKMAVSLWNGTQGPILAPACRLEVPAGWTVEGAPTGSDLSTMSGCTFAYTIKVPLDAAGPQTVSATVAWRGGETHTHSTVQVIPTVTAEVPPIAPVAEFRTFCHRFGLDHLLHVVPCEVVAVSGLAAAVPVRIVNHGGQPATLSVAATCPALHLAPPRQTVSVPGGEQRSIVFPIQIPDAVETGTFPLRVALNGSVADEGMLKVVPSLTVPRVTGRWTVDGSLSKYSAFPSHRIDRLWEGKTSGPADLSGQFWVVHDAHTLYVAVDVTDDVVVANIAPDDNRGHWRTDSVEICVQGENTFKVGIIPFNTEGHPMAARDADAHPGPIEKTAPGMRILSKRTDKGYCVEASIPMRSLFKVPPASFGFNVLLYDSDNKDATLSHARAAWSAWPDIQGTPRLWGRATLR